MIELEGARGDGEIIGQNFAVLNTPMRRSTAWPPPALIKQLYGNIGQTLRDAARSYGACDATADDCDTQCSSSISRRRHPRTAAIIADEF